MKLKLGLIFGGMSTENEVSVMSANSILKNLDKTKYDVFPIYISKNGEWYQYDNLENIEICEDMCDMEKIENITEYLQKLDVLFPVLHGAYGEDGSIQGLFEMLKKPYVGCGVLASTIGMDKVYSKIIFDRENICQAPYIYLEKCKGKYKYSHKRRTDDPDRDRRGKSREYPEIQGRTWKIRKHRGIDADRGNQGRRI